MVAADGKDLSFVTVTVADANDDLVPRSMNQIGFQITGPGDIIATDNGDATDTVVFSSRDRRAFNGLALAIVRTRAGQTGQIVVTATSQGLTDSDDSNTDATSGSSTTVVARPLRASANRFGRAWP